MKFLFSESNKWSQNRAISCLILLLSFLATAPAIAQSENERITPFRDPGIDHFEQDRISMEADEKKIEDRHLCTMAVINYFRENGVVDFQSVFFNHGELKQYLLRKKIKANKFKIQLGHNLDQCHRESLFIYITDTESFGFLNYVFFNKTDVLEPEFLRSQWLISR